MTPQLVNASYNRVQNEITFPAANLRPPSFDAKADNALNHGGIRAVIGHAMTHGYDDRGAQLHAQRNLKNWWTHHDNKPFEAHIAKLAKQFDNYVAIDERRVHGNQTLG